jgi:hypothetical protein
MLTLSWNGGLTKMKASFLYISKLLIALPLLIVTVVNAQESPSVLVGAGRDELQLKFNLINAIPRSEIPKLQNISNYKLYELVKPEVFAAIVAGNAAVEIVRINSIVDEKEKKAELDSSLTVSSIHLLIHFPI